MKNRLTRMYYSAILMDTTALEYSISLYCIFFGAWLLLPINTFYGNESFKIMAGLAPEVVWGLVFFLTGAAKLIALHVLDISARKVIAAIVLGLWTMVDISVFASGSTSTAGAVFLVTVLSSAWCIVSISVRNRVKRI